MKEKTIEEYLRNQIKQIGGKAYKFLSPGNAGVPDRLICLPNGQVIFVELKALGKKPTPLQQKKHLELSSLGQKVFIADNYAEVNRIVDYCKGLIKQ